MTKRITIFASFLLLISCSLIDDPNSFISKYQYSENLDRETIDSLVDQDYMDQLGEVIQVIRKNYRSEKKEEYKGLAQSYHQADSIKFKFLSDFYALRAKEDGSVISLEHLKKPSFNDMLAIYLKLVIGYNEMMHLSGVIEERDDSWHTWEDEVEYALNNLNSTNTLTSRYYNEVFRQKGNDQLPSNINFNELNLTKEESVIFYYYLLLRFGWDMRIVYRKEEQRDCEMIMELAAKIPTFNGQHFSEFQMPPLKNFKRFDGKTIGVKYFWDKYSYNTIKSTIDIFNVCKNN